MEKGRRTEVKITFDGAEITNDINGRILSVSFTDAEEGHTDDLQFVIDDREGVWVKDWLDKYTLSRKSTLTAVITATDETGESSLDCGSFEVDSVLFTGPPCRLTVKGTSLAYVTAMRQEEKSRTWESITYSGIAGDICGEAGVKLNYCAAKDPFYEAADQYELTDTEFLWKLAQDDGLYLKFVNGALVVYDDATIESAPVVRKIVFGESDILSWSLDTNAIERVYCGCVVRYTDPDTGNVIRGEYMPGGHDSDMTVYYVDQKVENTAEAEALAEATYKSAILEAFTGNFTMVGDICLTVGVNVELVGFGAFDGIYTISSACHTVSGHYVTSISIKKL